MAAVVDDVPALPPFHAWQNSLDHSQGSKQVHFLGHIEWTHSTTLNHDPIPALLTAGRLKHVVKIMIYRPLPGTA